jgi:predicted Rossmann-fold nucleotide-binding protein
MLTALLTLFLASAEAPSATQTSKKEEKITVGLLGSDRNGNNKQIVLDVKKLASQIDSKKVRVIYNGGGSGLRHQFVEEFIAKGGEVSAYKIHKEKTKTPQSISSRHFSSDAERLDSLYKDCDLFLVLPGGMETLSEITFIVDQNSLKDAPLRPVIVFDTDNYYDRFFQFVDYIEKQGMMDHKRLFRRTVRQEKQIPKVLSQIGFESKKD